MASKDEVTVLITGFGPFLNIRTNPSSLILPLLPSTLTLTNNPTTKIKIITPSPLPAIYTSLTSVLPDNLISSNPPDITIHIGLATDRTYFAIEKGAFSSGYHEYPDENRRVVLKSHWGKDFKRAPLRLDSYFNIPDVVKKWTEIFSTTHHQHQQQQQKAATPNTSKNAKGKQAGVKSQLRPNARGGEKEVEVELRASDDVGDYVCGWLYYNSLHYFFKRGEKARVVFLHVPLLEGEEELAVGRDVVLALVEALVGSL